MAASKRYPAIRFVIRYGNALALLVAAAIVLLGVVVGARSGEWLNATIIVVAGALMFLLLRAFAELVDVVADTLLPPE
jgi:putative Ca2+/H+ antiporter (TMEM165/GDT1 family)